MLTIFKEAIAAQLPGIPVTYWEDRKAPSSDEEVTAFIEKVQTDFQADNTAMEHQPAQAKFPPATKEAIKKLNDTIMGGILRY